MRSKKVEKIVLIIIYFLLILISYIGISFYTGEEEKLVALVNGEPIEVLEWKAMMDEKRSEVLSKFPSGLKEKQAVEQLKQTALEECIRRQIILQLAKREGLIEQITYGELLEQMKKENEERKRKKEEGGIIYGVQEYNPQTYFTYLFSNLVPDLIAALREKELKIEENELLEHYHMHPELVQNKPESASIIIWSIQENSKMTKEEKKAELLKIRKKVLKGKMEIPLKDTILKTQMEVSRNSRIIQRDPVLEKEVFQLRENECSKVVKNGEQYFIIYCKEYSPERKWTFKEQKSSMETTFRKEKFDHLIDQKGKEADIEIKETVYENFLPE